MNPFRNLKLRAKLIGSFILLAVVTGVVGGAGYWGTWQLKKDVHDIAYDHLPTVEALRTIETGGAEIKAAQRTLLALGIDPAIRQQQFDNVAKARERYAASWKKYESLPKSPKEEAAWKEFTTRWTEFRQQNDECFRLAAEIDKYKVGDPSALVNRLEAARASHNRVCRQTLEMLHSKKVFDGGDNHTACDIGKWLASYRTENADLAAAIQAAAKDHQKFHEVAAQIKNLVRQGDTGKATSLYYAEMAPAADAVLAQFDKMQIIVRRVESLHKEMCHQTLTVCHESQNKASQALSGVIQSASDEAHKAVQDAEQTASQAILTVVTVTLAAFATALALGFALALSITRPLIKGVAFAEAMAKGDLAQTLDICRNDEIGMLATTLNEMGANLRRMFTEIASTTTVLAGSSTELSATASQLASGADQTTSQSATVAAAAEEMSTNMTSMAASTEEMSGNVKTVASAVEELTASISEVARSAEQAAVVANAAADLARTGNAKIGELGSAAGEIGKVIEVIEDIAEQTNLLALNATIEAARAGDAGKGFAVVATEVKELARQTAAATEDIRRRIEGIQNSTGHVVHAIGEIGEVIKKVNEVSRTIASAVEEQSITTKEIARNVAQTSTAAQMVAKGVAESASATQEIARNIVQVDEAAKHTAQGAGIAQNASGKVTSVTEQLRSLVGQFKTSA